MSTKNINLLWKDFKGIRRLHSVNSDKVLGAEIAHSVRLSKEKSGEARSIRSSGWFSLFATAEEKVIRLFAANMSGYPAPDQLIAFTKTNAAINAWVIYDSTGNSVQTKIATFSLADDVTDVCMVQWGDRLVVVVAFGTNKLGFICYSGTTLTGWTQMGSTGCWYREESITEHDTSASVNEITRVKPYRSRLAINGVTSYTENTTETIYGVWFSEAGNPINFNKDYLSSATDTSAFFCETGEKVNQLEEYHGLTAFCRNRSYNITGTSQNTYQQMPLTAKGVFGNATFTMNGKCGYVDSWSNNIFTLRDNIDGTIGFDEPVGDDIQEYLTDVDEVTINSLGRRVRILKKSGQSLVYDVDIREWTEETFMENARAVTFLDAEYICYGDEDIYVINETWGMNALQVPNDNGYYSHYRTNLIWLDSQSSVKSHLYPFAIILEPNTSNKFHIKFTTDRGDTYEYQVTKAGFENAATYSNSDAWSEENSYFSNDDDVITGGVFLSQKSNELLVTVDRPPFWRYLQIDIYTVAPDEQFNISGIEAKNTMVTDEMLEY